MNKGKVEAVVFNYNVIVGPIASRAFQTLLYEWICRMTIQFRPISLVDFIIEEILDELAL
ncbi:hypothetical protein LZG74_16535 [Dyadobacter sp. CY327]|uniref:hypothetical protein n=1 Tax=Dyadobacter sp. CY327 TaxID=2907301 RepID=UPI001F2CE86B|nr:hypothetical protein [Dyadobacter sp. CY327]MCE7071924.1 hypothetical protein [Dyadobacter sp. CY327]